MTAGQQAIADGFAANLAVHGQTWTRPADGKLIAGVPATLKPTSPHMVNAPDMAFPILVADAAMTPPLLASQVMPTPRLKKGDELTKGGKSYRVTRADYEESTALWVVILTTNF